MSHHHHHHSHVHNKKHLLEGQDLLRPILKGYMFKQSHVHKAFNKRFFALYSRIMVYYEKEDEFLRDASRGTFEVLNLCACVRVKERSCCIFFFLFSIVTRPFVLMVYTWLSLRRSPREPSSASSYIARTSSTKDGKLMLQLLAVLLSSHNNIILLSSVLNIQTPK